MEVSHRKSRVRRAAALLASAAAVALAAGCSSGQPSPTPRASRTAANAGTQNGALVVQCMLDQHLIPHAAQAGLLPVLKNGQVPWPGMADPLFFNWYQSEKGLVVAGKDLDSWAASVGEHKTLPAALCGSQTSPEQMFARLFPGKPNPWPS